METILVYALFALVIFGAVMIAANRNLFVATLLSSIVSLFVALIFASLNAPDVALTEAAVGAGASTLFFLGVLTQTGSFHSYKKNRPLSAFVIATVFFMLMVYSTLSLPPYGEASAVAQTHLARYFLEHTPADIGLPNVVTAILASYRGFDTFGELLVIFTAGMATIGIYSLRKKHLSS
ncbi:MAG: DUF4040 domain-containing protein [Candidatus Oxydemutatoraceae bacterium WSBS_2016_MAG_OTU14]